MRPDRERNEDQNIYIQYVPDGYFLYLCLYSASI